MGWSKLWWVFVAYNSVMFLPCVLTRFLLAWGITVLISACITYALVALGE